MASPWALQQRGIESTRERWTTAPHYHKGGPKTRGVGSRRKARHAWWRTVARGKSTRPASVT